MTENVGTIQYVVEADTAKLIESTSTLDGSLDRLDRRFRRTDKAANDTTFQMKKTAAAVQGLGRESQSAATQISGLTKVFGGLLTLHGARGLLSMAEGYTEMADRVTIATSSLEEYEMVQRRLLATSNATERALSEAQELFLQSSQGIKDLGYTTSQTLDITDSLSHAFAANAASAQSASTAITAFSKATIRGKVDSMGWISIMTAAPTLLNDIAAAAGKTTAEVNQMGVDGEVTAQMLTEGLRKSLDANRALDASMSKTVAGSFTKLRNNLSAYVGEANRSTGATQVMADAVGYLADNIDTLATALVVGGAGALAKYIAQLGASVTAKAAAGLAAQRQAFEELKLAQAHVTQTQAALRGAQANIALGTSMRTAANEANAAAAAKLRLAAAQRAVVTSASGLLSVLGGPVGVIALIASAAAGVAVFGRSSRAAKDGVDSLKSSVDALRGSLSELNAESLNSAATQIQSRLDDTARLAEQTMGRIQALQKRMAEEPKHPDFSRWQREVTGLAGAYTEAQKNAAMLRDRLKEIEDTGKRREAFGGPSGSKEDPEVQKRLQGMRDELELAKLTGEARARLAAIQKLGANATQEEREEAERLAAEIYRLEEAQKGRTAATKESIKADNENAKVIEALRMELLEAAFGGEALAEAKALASLNKFATPEEVQTVRELSQALSDMREAERMQEELRKADDVYSEQARFEEEMERLRMLNEAKLLEDERYYELKEEAEELHQERMQQLQEEAFRQQSATNEMLMSSLDRLEVAASGALVGLATGAQNSKDAMRALGQAILQDAVGALVKMGVQYVKNLIMGKAAEALVGKSSVALGGSVASAWAPAAAMVSLATLGANAGPANMGIATTVALSQGLAAAGGRQYGGPVAPNNMYRINENGKPEVLNMANGQQFLLPNTRGEVVSNKDATKGGSQVKLTVNLIEDASRGGEVNQTVSDDEHALEIFVADIGGGGKRAQALESTYGLERRGR